MATQEKKRVAFELQFGKYHKQAIRSVVNKIGEPPTESTTSLTIYYDKFFAQAKVVSHVVGFMGHPPEIMEHTYMDLGNNVG